MKRIVAIAAATGLFACCALAQDPPDQLKLQLEKLTAQAKVISINDAVMGPAVKNAPYTADEIRETNQTLGDGTKIHTESKVTVYRDSQGRVRRETPDEITIWDPGAGTNYVLHPKDMTARKMNLNFVFTKSADGLGPVTKERQAYTFAYSTTSDMSPASASQAMAEAKARAEKMDMEVRTMNLAGGRILRRNGKTESLGSQMMEGVNADGERTTSTIEVGEIGNDRPIVSSSERWFSQELQVQVLSKRSDPRAGDETTRLTNIRRGEPSSVLFEVPPGYTIVGK